MKKILCTIIILVCGLSSVFAVSNFTVKDLTGQTPSKVTDCTIKGMKLSWDLNTETDMHSYVVYYSVNSLDNFTTHTRVIHPTNIWINDINLIRYNTYYWVITAWDQSQNESGPSNIVQVNVVNANPKFTSSTLHL